MVDHLTGRSRLLFEKTTDRLPLPHHLKRCGVASEATPRLPLPHHHPFRGVGCGVAVKREET